MKLVTWSRDPADRARDHLAMLRTVTKWQPRIARIYRRRFRDERAALLDSNPQTTGDIIEGLLGIQRRQEASWMRAYRQTYTEVGKELASMGVPPQAQQRQDDHFVDVAWGPIDDDWWHDFFRPRLGNEPWWDEWLRGTLRYAETEGSKKIRLINANTRRRVQLQIHTALQRGEGIVDMMRRIDRLYLDSIIPNRSEVIARTEALTAARNGEYQATRSSGYGAITVQDWLATADGRDRATHLAAMATEVEIDFGEPFTVGGAKLLFPGDTSLGAPAEEVVQCRCDVVKRIRI